MKARALKRGLGFRAKTLSRSFPKALLETHQMQHLNTKGMKASVSYSRKGIYSAANGELL